CSARESGRACATPWRRCSSSRASASSPWGAGAGSRRRSPTTLTRPHTDLLQSGAESSMQTEGVQTAGAAVTEARLKASAARLSVAAAALLITLKAVTGVLTGSISVWASLLDSTMDIFASAINYFAVRAASAPPDEDHHYGPRTAESVAGL